VDEGLQVPWSFVFLPDGHILLTERAGRLRLIVDGRLVDEPVAGVPSVIERDEGGLMALALAPDYATSGWIYLSFSDPGAGETAMTKIVRGRLRDNRFTDVETVFAVPLGNYQPGYVGFGSRLAFRGDDLFFTVGERGVVGDAQRLDVPNGKIHRVRPDGSAPPDNPFAGRAAAMASIWSYGHRNPQGLAIDPRDGAIWSSEHGPRGGDELNRTDAGDNCGWPLVTFGMNYDGTPVSDRTEAPGLRAPVRHWTPSIAVSQIAFYTGDRFPGWRNNLFVGSLARQTLYRLEVEGRSVRHEEEIFRNLGRIRDIRTGPDGLLYVLLEQLGGASGRLVRLVPAQ
jgi:glucose/arabinose dehydrogenase